MPDDVLFEKSYKIMGNDFNHAGEVSTDIKSLLMELGVDPVLIRRLVIATFEAEMNVVMYADEANLELKLMHDKMYIRIEDRGQGIEDIQQAMVEGFSTATEKMREMGFGAGMGLPNIKKNSDIFNIESEVGVGTTLEIIINI